MAELVECPTCHQKVSTNARSCPSCGECKGYPFEKNTEVTQMFYRKSIEPKWIVINFFIVVGALMTISLIGFFLFDINETSYIVPIAKRIVARPFENINNIRSLRCIT